MKNYLAPSILSADLAHLGEDIQHVKEAGATCLHYDVMDGAFVPSISFGMPVLRSVRKITDLVLDVHLMIEKPERYIDEFADCGADIITIHYEAFLVDETPEALIHVSDLPRKILDAVGEPDTLPPLPAPPSS